MSFFESAFSRLTTHFQRSNDLSALAPNSPEEMRQKIREEIKNLSLDEVKTRLAVVNNEHRKVFSAINKATDPAVRQNLLQKEARLKDEIRMLEDHQSRLEKRAKIKEDLKNLVDLARVPLEEEIKAWKERRTEKISERIEIINETLQNWQHELTRSDILAYDRRHLERRINELQIELRNREAELRRLHSNETSGLDNLKINVRNVISKTGSVGRLKDLVVDKPLTTIKSFLKGVKEKLRYSINSVKIEGKADNFFSNPDGEYNQSKNALQDQVKTLDKKLHFIDKQLSQNSPDSGEHLSFQERRVLLGEQKQLVKERKGIIKDIRRMSFRLGTYTMIKESKQGSRLSNEDAARMEALMHQVQNIAVARIAEVEAKESGESENKEDMADVDQLTILDDISIIDQGRVDLSPIRTTQLSKLQGDLSNSPIDGTSIQKQESPATEVADEDSFENLPDIISDAENLYAAIGRGLVNMDTSHINNVNLLTMINNKNTLRYINNFLFRMISAYINFEKGYINPDSLDLFITKFFEQLDDNSSVELLDIISQVASGNTDKSFINKAVSLIQLRGVALPEATSKVSTTMSFDEK